MRQICETPPLGGGASRDLLGGWSRHPITSAEREGQSFAPCASFFPLIARKALAPYLGERGDA